MKSKFNPTYFAVVVFLLFAIVAATPYILSGGFVADEVSGALTYAAEKGTKCTDSDSGKDYYTFGRATNDAGVAGSDDCVGNNVLEEYYCTGDGEVAKEYYTCGINYECSNGACVKENQCTDTDDGLRYFEKGTASVGDQHYTDYCQATDKLVEYYCTPVGLVEEGIRSCARGCVDGACIPSRAE